MPTIQDIRVKFPQYNDMSDQQLADALHAKYYPDMPKDQYYGKINFNPEKPSPYAPDAAGNDLGIPKARWDQMPGAQALVRGFEGGADQAIQGVQTMFGPQTEKDNALTGAMRAISGGAGAGLSPISGIAAEIPGATPVLGGIAEALNWLGKNTLGNIAQAGTQIVGKAAGNPNAQGIPAKDVGDLAALLLGPKALHVGGEVVKAGAKVVAPAINRIVAPIAPAFSDNAARHEAGARMNTDAARSANAANPEGFTTPDLATKEGVAAAGDAVTNIGQSMASPTMWQVRPDNVTGVDNSFKGIPFGTGTAMDNTGLLQAEKRIAQGPGSVHAANLEGRQQQGMNDMLDQHNNPKADPNLPGTEAGIKIAQAANEADTARAGVQPTMLPEEASKTVFERQQAAEAANQKAVNEAYNGPLNEAKDAGITASVTALDNIFDPKKLSDTVVGRDAILPVIDKVFNPENFPTGRVPILELRAINNELSRRLGLEAAKGTGFNHEIFSAVKQMQDGVRGLMEQAAKDAGRGDLAKAFQDARALRTEVGKVEGTRSVSTGLNERSIDAGNAMSNYVRPGPEGATAIRELLNHTKNDPEVIRSVESRILEGAKDLKSAAQVDAYIKQFGPTLRMPEFMHIEEALKRLGESIDYHAEISSGILGDIAKKNPDNAVQSVINSDNPATALKDIQSKLSTAAWAGFKQAILEHIQTKIQNGTLKTADGSTHITIGKSVNNTLQRFADQIRLVEPGLAKTLKTLSDLQEVMNRRKSSVVGDNSSTSFLTGANAMDNVRDTFLHHLHSKVLTAGGAGAGYLAAGPVGGLLGGAAGNAISLASEVGVTKALSQMLHDPVMAKKWMTKASEGNWSMFPKDIKAKMAAAGITPEVIKNLKSGGAVALRSQAQKHFEGAN
jgi:hypothetical protein